MRLIGTLPTPGDAQRFCDYLLTQKIRAHHEPGSDAAFQIWIENDDQLDAGRNSLAEFQANPADARYDASAEAKKIKADAGRAAARRRKNFTDVRTSMFGGGRPTPVTVSIIFLTVVLAALMKFGQDTPLLRALLFDDPSKYSEGFTPGRFLMFDDVARGQLWRLFTPIFIHFGVLHLVFNMMWMADLGRRIESAIGGTRLVAMVLAIAILSCTAEALWTALSPLDSSHFALMGGMSGVVAGLFGYAWMCGHFRPYQRIAVSQYEIGLMLGWLVLCSLGWVGPIANAAHWGGLVVGMAIGAAPTLAKRMRRLER